MRLPTLAAAGLLTVSACTLAQPPVKSLSFADGGIRATAPAGYCLDPVTSRPGDGFAVLAPCATLGGRDGPPDVLAVATVQVGAAESAVVAGQEQALMDLLNTEAGAALLSTTGSAESIRINSTQIGENTVTVAFEDNGERLIPGTDAVEYRAFTDIGGRLVTVGVRGLDSRPLDAGTGSWLLNRIVDGVIPVGPAAPETETSAS